MKRFVSWIGMVCIVFLGGCIDLTEEIHFNEDGSGSYRMTMDFSQMMEMMGGALDEDENTFGDEMGASFEQTMNDLRKLDGITEVMYVAEDNQYTIKYKFANLAVLNKAIALNSAEDGLTPQAPAEGGPTFTRKKNKLERVPIPEVEEEEDEELSPEMMEAMLGKASYKTIYHFDQTVKRCSNKQAAISEDGHTVTLDIPLSKLLAGEAKVANKIKLK